MTDERKKVDPEPSNAPHEERRRKQRYPVPAVYQTYISLKVKNEGIFVPVILHDFSAGGILFESRFRCEVEQRADCLISALQLLSREIAFRVQVKHCRKTESGFLVGAAIEKADDATWFRIFTEVHDFIIQREGTVY